MNRVALFGICLVAASIVSFILFASSGGDKASAQSTCCHPPTDDFAPNLKFPQGATVTVTISSDWQATERADIITAIGDWNYHAFFNGSGVFFDPIVIGSTPSTSANTQFIGYSPSLNVAGQNSLHYSGGPLGGAFYAHMAIGSHYLNIENPELQREYFRYLIRHEIGHTFLLLNAYSCGNGTTIMAQPASTLESEIRPCDDQVICSVYGGGTCSSPTPSPSPQPTNTPGGCNGVTFPDGTCSSGFVANGGYCQRSSAFMSNCFEGGDYDFDSCLCTGGCWGPSCSPIVVDVLGNGFSLTNTNNGVNFNLDNVGPVERIAWTSNGSDDAWLALDRNGDGVIDSGKELFGNVTPQEPAAPDQRDGFRALAIYDQMPYGGDGDGKITRHDSVFERLKLWQDLNHDGVSETCELFNLRDLGLRSVDLDYVESQRVDGHGNEFRYRSRVRDVNGAQLGRWAWDVFLVVQQP